MKARKRGLSQEMTAGASWSANSSRTAPGLAVAGRGLPAAPCPARPCRPGSRGPPGRAPAATGSSRRSAKPGDHRGRTSGCAPIQLAATRRGGRAPNRPRRRATSRQLPVRLPARPARYSEAARSSSTLRGSKRANSPSSPITTAMVCRLRRLHDPPSIEAGHLPDVGRRVAERRQPSRGRSPSEARGNTPQVWICDHPDLSPVDRGVVPVRPILDIHHAGRPGPAEQDQGHHAYGRTERQEDATTRPGTPTSAYRTPDGPAATGVRNGGNRPGVARPGEEVRSSWHPGGSQGPLHGASSTKQPVRQTCKVAVSCRFSLMMPP